jgi:uncharacterized damage-inducible protein DinB
MQQVLDQLAASEATLLRQLEGLTPEQFTFRPAPNRWSIAEIVEHIIAVEARVTRAITKSITQPPTGELPNLGHKDAALWKMVPNRTRTLDAPEFVRPTGRFTATTEASEHLTATRARTIHFAKTTEADLRAYQMPHMAFGDLDFHQWLIVLSLHGTRHAAQIEEIKSHPTFPKT